MSTALYHPYVENARRLLASAEKTARLYLSPAIKQQHWMTSKHSPAPWRSVEAWYRTQPDWNDTMATTLTHLALLSDALAALNSIANSADNDVRRPINLKLAKTKRVEL